MRTFGILFYTAALVFLGLLLIVFAALFSFPNLQPQCINYVVGMLSYLQESANYRIILALSGLLLIVVSFSFAQLILAKFQREKTIAFSTPSGEVTISLSAIEDLLRHFAAVIPEIKELKPNVIATKKGSIVVDLKVVLKSEANIPELTAHLQDMTKTKIQEVLGVEEQIIVRIHISKIMLREEKDRKKKEPEASIPFGGYTRV